MALAQTGAIAGKSILSKIFIYGSGILLIIVLLQSFILSAKEHSFRPLLVETGQRILATDAYLYTWSENMKNNPEKIYYQAKYAKSQETFASDPNRLQLEIMELNTKWSKFKFFFTRLWTYFDMFLSVWFLVTMFIVFMWITRALITQNTSLFSLGNFLGALMIFIFLQLTFTLMLYDSRLNDNKDFKDLPISKQAILLAPAKGLFSLTTNFKYLVGLSYEKVVKYVDESKTNPNPAVSIPTKILS